MQGKGCWMNWQACLIGEEELDGRFECLLKQQWTHFKKLHSKIRFNHQLHWQCCFWTQRKNKVINDMCYKHHGKIRLFSRVTRKQQEGSLQEACFSHVELLTSSWIANTKLSLFQTLLLQPELKQFICKVSWQRWIWLVFTDEIVWRK